MTAARILGVLLLAVAVIMAIVGSPYAVPVALAACVSMWAAEKFTDTRKDQP